MINASIAFSLLVAAMISMAGPQIPDAPAYNVQRLKGSLKIDANWNKPAWRRVKEIVITNYMGQVPAFKPVTRAKMMYDAENVYVIFKVDDQFVRLQTQQFGGKVFEDACVEFFFSPDSSNPLNYFNLEMNAGGMALMEYHVGRNATMLSAQEFSQVEIAHSMPATLAEEFKEPVTWTVEYKLPLAVMKKYSAVTQPQPGTTWKANFFKTSSRSSNPHYITWSFVDNPTPRFHMPQFFGNLQFK